MIELIRYTFSVERVTLIARFMDSTPLRSNPSLQAALTNAFCYLITSMDDNNVHVAQRATLYLGTIHDTAIRVGSPFNGSRSIQPITNNFVQFTVADLLSRDPIRFRYSGQAYGTAIALSVAQQS